MSKRRSRPRLLPVIRECDHPVEIQLGGAEVYGCELPPKLKAYRTAVARIGTFEPLPGVPKTRADCPPNRNEKVCPYVSCRFSLVRQDTPPGRPNLARVARDSNGCTKRVTGRLGEQQMSIEPLWLMEPTPASCALDVASAGLHDNTALAKVMRRHRTLAARLVKEALRALKAKGVEREDLMLLVPESLR